MTPNQHEQADLIVETFEMLGEWDEKYRFIIDLGRQMPPMDPADKTDATKVNGCLSSVWVVADSREVDGHTAIDFTADSDSAIVKGLVAILRMVYSGQTPQAIVSFDIDELFSKIDLGQHLSMGRRNGLSEMVRKIKSLAAEKAAA